MKSFANWMIVTFMAMFWGFRVFITYMATSGSDFIVKPIDTTVEIVLLFITLACIILVIKRQLFGGILYTVANVGYFGTDAWLAVKPLLTGETMSAGNSLTVLVAVVAVILAIAVMMDLFADRLKAPDDKKTEWFYDNKEFDRKFDDRADKNNYKTL